MWVGRGAGGSLEVCGRQWNPRYKTKILLIKFWFYDIKKMGGGGKSRTSGTENYRRFIFISILVIVDNWCPIREVMALVDNISHSRDSKFRPRTSRVLVVY